MDEQLIVGFSNGHHCDLYKCKVYEMEGESQTGVIQERREWNKLEVNTGEIISTCVCVWEIEKRNKAMDWSMEGRGVKTEFFRDKKIIARINADDNIQSMGIKRNSGYHGENFQEQNPWEYDIGWVQSTTEYMVLD